MPVSTNKILVKVGKSSNLKFRGAQAFRAVTLNELKRLSELNPDASVAVIEYIKPSDNDTVKEFIRDFEALGKDHKVFFYVSDNEDNTCGIADELAYDIYLTAEDLYRAIKINCGITVDTDLSKSSEINNISPEDAFDNQFEDTWAPVADNTGLYELPGVDSKDDVNDFDSSIMDEVDDTTDEVTQPSIDGIDTNELASSNQTIKEAGSETVQDSEPISAEQLKELDELRGKLSSTLDKLKLANTEVDQLKDQLHKSISRNNELVKLSKALEHERDIIKDKLNVFDHSEVMEEPITLTEYQSLQATIQSLQDKIKDLSANGSKAVANSEQVEELSRLLEEANAANDTIREQLEDYRKRLRESGSRLTNAQTKLAQYEQELAELNDKATEVEELRIKVGQVDTYKNKAKEADSLRIKVAELEAKLSTAGANSTELQDAKAEVIASKQTIADQSSKISGLKTELDSTNAELSKARQLVNTLNSKVSEITQDLNSARTEIQSRIDERKEIEDKLGQVYRNYYTLVDMLGIAAEQIYNAREASGSSSSIIASLDATINALKSDSEAKDNKIKELEEKLNSFADSERIIASKDKEIKRLNETNDSNRSIIASLRETVDNYENRNAELSRQVDEADHRVELARNFASTEKDEIKRKLDESNRQLAIVKGQLADKESQYNQLVESSGMNEGGVSALLENSKAIEVVNKTLREQVVTLKTELEEAKSAKIKAEQSALALEESNKSMRLSMQSMNELVGGGAASKPTTIRPIKYSSKGVIIPVFGYGSYGITTTAMSLAHKLSTQAQVLYIDFDMVAPKADEWFRTPPTIKDVPAGDLVNNKRTGLGLLVEKQFKFFVENVHVIINRPVNTKAGCIDYLSGFYAKPDMNKLMVTDFGALLDYCGSHYSYVIIDFGTLGTSDISDQIIKAVSDIAYRSVVVTQGDKFSIMKFRGKLTETKINVSKLCWLVNMCTSTRIDDNSKKRISPIPFGMMQFNADIYGKYINFTQDSLLRDKLSLFMEQVLFRR